jgi:hypothetical protein
MTKHVINMMVREVLTNEDAKELQLYDDLAKLPYSERIFDVRTVEYVKKLHDKWRYQSRITLLATLGWQAYESAQIFCMVLENLKSLREQYR